MVATTDRTRAWESPTTNTVVQFRTDTAPMVWIHSNIGWLPVGNAPDNMVDAEAMAEEIARNYGLTESDNGRARMLAGWEE